MATLSTIHAPGCNPPPLRPSFLQQILQLALGALQRLPGMRADNALLEQALRLLVATLSFDFVGTCLDESAEDLGTIQIPTAWRPAIEDAGTLQLLWGYYAGNEPPLSSLALESLVSGGMGGNGEG